MHGIHKIDNVYALSKKLEPTQGHQICSTIQILIINRYLKMRESLYARVIVQINTVLNNIGASAM